MVADLQREGVVVCGQRYPVLCYLKGDGKGMKAAHHKAGSCCWHCDTAFADFGGEKLAPCPVFPTACAVGGNPAGYPPAETYWGYGPRGLPGD